MAFKATEQVDPLDYDFRPYLDDTDIPRNRHAGTVPEPTENMINEFIHKWQLTIREITRLRLTSSTKSEDDMTEQELADHRAEQEEIEDTLPRTVGEALSTVRDSTVDLEDSNAITDELATLTATVCQDQPNKDTIQALPGRIRAAFYGWIVGELANPEPAAAVTRPDLRAV